MSVNTNPPTSGKIVYEVFTASGTWTRPSNVSVINALLVGGGGGGGIAVARGREAASSYISVAGGGGAGGQVLKTENIYVGAYTSLTVTVGAGGSGGSVTGDGTTTATCSYSQNGSPSTLSSGTTTLLNALGGGYGYNGQDGTAGTLTATSSTPDLIGFSVGGRASGCKMSTSSTKFVNMAGCGAGAGTAAFTGSIVLADWQANSHKWWQGRGQITMIDQANFTAVASASVVGSVRRINFGSLVQRDEGNQGGSDATQQARVKAPDWSQTSVTWSDQSNVIAGSFLTTDSGSGRVWSIPELEIFSTTKLHGGLGLSYQTSTGTQKLNLGFPGYGIDGYGGGGWGGILTGSQYQTGNFTSTSFPVSGSYNTNANGAYVHVGPYQSRMRPTLGYDSNAANAGANGTANTGDGGCGATAFANSNTISLAKGGDGGSGICIIWYAI